MSVGSIIEVQNELLWQCVRYSLTTIDNDCSLMKRGGSGSGNVASAGGDVGRSIKNMMEEHLLLLLPPHITILALADSFLPLSLDF